MKVAIFILTFNEELHIERAVSSALKITNDIYVIDSFSRDSTKVLAEKLGAKVIQKEWRGFSLQINYAINFLKEKYDWVIRLDADEYFSEEFVKNISFFLRTSSNYVNGIFVERSIIFKNHLIRYGGLYKVPVIRIFNPKEVYCDDKEMDEKIRIKRGKTSNYPFQIIDKNEKDLNFWVKKHLTYSDLEIKNIYLKKYDMKSSYSKNSKNELSKDEIKLLYYKLIPSLRCFLLFLYRYIYKLGFLDGLRGFYFHFLQTLWYRLVIDFKLLYK